MNDEPRRKERLCEEEEERWANVSDSTPLSVLINSVGVEQ